MFKEIASDGFPARAKNVRIKFRGKYYKYPLEALDIAKSMSPFLAARAFLDYSFEALRRKLRPRELVSAEDWVVQAMGRTLYGLFFGPYTTKVWGIPPSQLAASFAQHRIPHISLMKVITSSLRKGREAITMADIQPGDHVFARGGLENNVFVPKTVVIIGPEQWKRMQEWSGQGGGQRRRGAGGAGAGSAPAAGSTDAGTGGANAQKPAEPQN